MPQFTNEPPNDSHQHNFRLIRTPAGTPFKGYVLSENLVGCPTHYIGNRTVPCEPENCEACDNGLGWRWHGYLLVMVQATSELVIFEMTATAAEKFTEYFQRHGTLRGCHFLATRVNNRSNGRVLIIAKPADLSQIHLPQPKDCRKLLAHIWNIAPNQVTQDGPNHRPPAETLHIDRNKPELPRIAKTYTSLQQHQEAIKANTGNGNRPAPPPADN